MKYLVTGGCGFLGVNVAAQLLASGEDVTVLDNLCRHGSFQNLQWLQTKGDLHFIHADIRNCNDVERTIKEIKPDIIYHLAGQVAMSSSIVDPRLDFEVNAKGSFNVLDAVRQFSPYSSVIYSSTNKVYGDLEQFTYRENQTRYECVEQPNGFDESVALNFHSPYGVSKGCADQYMLDFFRLYGVKTVVFRHSSMFGGRQFATYDQGWIGWFVQKAIEIETGTNKGPFTVSGSGKQVRDLLYASDCVELYLKAGKNVEILKGKVFNIGGGKRNSASLLELFYYLEGWLNIKMTYDKLPQRISDQKVFIANNKKIEAMINWRPKTFWKDGVREIYEWYKAII